MARMEAAVFVGLLLGSLSSGRLYKWTSASLVFGLATFCTLSGLVWVYCFVKESIKNETEERSRIVSLIPLIPSFQEPICASIEKKQQNAFMYLMRQKQNKSIFFLNFRSNSKRFSNGVMLLICFIRASSDVNEMTVF